jgi:2-iminobutanoate/2-iminopropanoate deaminase
MSHKIRDIGVSHQNWKYCDAVEVRPNLRWLFTSGTPGLEIHGTPGRYYRSDQTRWKHLLGVLKQANMDLTDVVKVTQYLTRAGDIEALCKGENSFSRRC